MKEIFSKHPLPSDKDFDLEVVLKELASSKNGIPDHFEKDDRSEAYWSAVKQAYSPSPQLLNLNNGGVGPQPICVQEAFAKINELCNRAPSYYLWKALEPAREEIRARLAKTVHGQPDELALMKSCTEALAYVILGLNLKRGDEVVLAVQDYPNMRYAWEERARRDGIVLRYINMELPQEDASYFLNLYTEAFTTRTRVLHLTHMVHYTGQMVPVAAIAAEARKRDILVVCDASHTFAQRSVHFPELGCDFVGTSLHKWLGAPFGTGLLWMKKEHIATLRPLIPGEASTGCDIRKFESPGARSVPAEIAVAKALDFHLDIGISRKENRLHFLKNYWTQKAAFIPKVKIHTSTAKEWSGALALFSIDGMAPELIENSLLNSYRIHAVGIDYANIKGVRISPNLNSSLEELDYLLMAIQEISERKANPI